MKPLLRWTIGGIVNNYSLDLLKASINSVLELYNDRLDYVICYNNLSIEAINYIKRFNIDLFCQTHCKNMEYAPKSVSWKLYPPRLRENSHELFIDNDIIIHSCSDIVEEFLNSSTMCFITQGYGHYGKYKDYIKGFNTYVNSGFFGLPPFFPFVEKIKYYQEKDLNRFWEDYFDEQSLVAACILNHFDKKIIPFSQIRICENDYEPSEVGSHFVGINKGNIKPWLHYLRYNIKLQ